MPIQPSYARHIETVLISRGFRKRQWRKGILGTRVYERHGRSSVVIPTIELPPPAVQPTGAAIDDYFRGLQGVLAGLGKRYPVTDLYLPGGGNLPLPGWFEDWCKENGIRVHLVTGEWLPAIEQAG
jgi:hypothetical protein